MTLHKSNMMPTTPTPTGETDMMNEQAFELLMRRFDRIEELLSQHVEEDKQFYKEVERHSIYWKAAAASLPVVGAYLLAKLGWK